MRKTTGFAALCAVLIIVFLLCSQAMEKAGGNKKTEPTNGAVIINEVVSSNSTSFTDQTLGSPDWIELYNPSEKPFDLTGCGLSDSKKNKFLFTFPQIAIGAGERLLVCCAVAPADYSGEYICTGFKLGKAGNPLFLTAPDGSTIQELSVPALETDISYGITQSGEYGFFSAPTPGRENGQGAKSIDELRRGQKTGLVISEVAPQSFAELYNAGAEPLELSEFFLTDDSRQVNKARLPAKTLAAGEYAVVYFADAGEPDALPFSIGKDERALWLYDGFGRVVDSLEWDADIFAGMSAGTENGELVYYYVPTPAEKNGGETRTGSFALTEGEPDVRINEVLRRNEYSIKDEKGRRQPWAELYNSTKSALELAGYYLSDDDDPFKFSLAGIEIPENGYAIVFLTGEDGVFRLGDSDDALTLTDARAGIKQTVALHGGLDEPNISYGAGDSGWLYFAQPTPGAKNDTKGFADAAQIGAALSYGMIISEVSGAQTAKSNELDWIELYNGSGADVSLDGWTLSDDRDELGRWKLSGTLKNGGYAAFDKAQSGADGEETTLSISLSGETLYLCNGGAVVNSLSAAVMRPNVSYGTTESGEALFTNPTKGKPNDEQSAVAGYCAEPEFSESGGVKSAAVTLKMVCKTENAKIYYTLDGSKPTNKSRLYEGEIAIEKSAPVRAIAAADGLLQSDETVATFLITDAAHTLPVVCLSISEEDKQYIFSSEDRLDKRERSGYVEYYEPEGKLGVRFPAGMRIAGNGTRLYPQRSINLYMRGGYGRSSVHYPFFEDYAIMDFASLSLRNSGQDNVSTRMRDAFFSMAVKGLNIDYAETRFCVVYINGAYYGLYELKENQNEDFFVSRHGVERKDVVMVRSNTYVYNRHPSRDIKNVFAQSRKDTSSDAVYEEFIKKVDPEFFADYLVAQTFFCNSDAYNQKYASSANYSMRWRPMLFDLDYAFLNSTEKRDIMPAFFSASGINLHMSEGGQSMLKVDTGLFNGLYKNSKWREFFVERYAYALNNVLTDEKLLERFDEMYGQIKGEMPRTIKKWGKPSSMDKWESETAQLRGVIQRRRPVAISQLKKNFDLSSDDIARLFPNS